MLEARNRARLQACMHGQIPDARPYCWYYSYDFVGSATGVNLREYLFDPKLMFETQMSLYNMLGGGISLIPDGAMLPENEALGAELVFTNGYPSTKHRDDVTVELLANSAPIDPYNGKLMESLLEALKYMREHAPSEISVEPTYITGPLSLAASVCGITDFLIDLCEEPDVVKQCLEVVTDSEISFLKEQEKILGSIDRVSLSDDISAFLSPEMFREFVIPTYDRIRAAFPDSQYWLHNDADTSKLYRDICSYGFDLWHVGYVMDIVQIANDTPESNTVLVGNLVPLDDLANSETETAVARAKALIERFGNSPRFAISTGGFLATGTPVETVRAIMHAADEYKLLEDEVRDR